MFVLDFLIRLFCGLLIISLPIALGMALQQRISKWRFFGMGALCFVASQVLHVPFNYFLLQPFLKHMFQVDLEEPSGFRLVILAIALGLSAGVFEEGSRWVLYRYWIAASSSSSENNNSSSSSTFSNSVMLGAGHGGCEAFLVGLSAILSLVYMTYWHSVKDLSTIIHDPDTLEKVQEALAVYWGAPWYAAMMAPLERVFAMTIHVALSLLVWNGFVTRNHKTWLGRAVAFHSAVDAVAVLVMFTLGVYVVEVILALTFFPAAVAIIYHFYKQHEAQVLQQQADYLEVPLAEEHDEYHEFPTPNDAVEEEVTEEAEQQQNHVEEDAIEETTVQTGEQNRDDLA